MLGTRLKNSNRITIFLMICIVLAPSIYIRSQYNNYNTIYLENIENQYDSYMNSEEFLGNFLEISYVLYNLEQRDEKEQKDTEDQKDTENQNNTEAQEDAGGQSGNPFEDIYGQVRSSYMEYEDMYPYLDYRVENQEGTLMMQSTANTGKVLTPESLKEYPFGVVIAYSSGSTPDIQYIYGDFKEEQSLVFRKLISNSENSWHILMSEGDDYGMERPEGRTYYFGITQDSLERYFAEMYDVGMYEDVSGMMSSTILLLMLLVAVLAWLCPLLPFWKSGSGKLLRAPFEAVVFAVLLGFLLMEESYVGTLEKGSGIARDLNTVCWMCFFAVVYWASSCLRQIYVLGPAVYARERTILYPSRGYIIKAWRTVKGKAAGWFKRIYHSLESIDLRENGNRAIFRIVLCNFVLLAAMCFMWYFGIMALCIYSAVLFFLLRRFYNDLREKYRVLLKATNQIAEGDLEVEITEDLGVFTPFRTEIAKIQTGFRKAVEEEVKSQRMKTELITNVSHDLKTPLTAIITYVNLLKEEQDEEKRKDYIRVLESKSMRLKVLIEDLFEISKASSKNVTLNLMEVDIVNLFKQVKLELEDKLSEAEIDFRCSYPEEKIAALLDSQKTYRIFENLLVNISKYALPHTRAYVEITGEMDEAVIRIKNVSAAELTFRPEEITERFVRGDLSRNTEGSGLGLAIVKSFTELQKGKFTIETEADLFKVELRFIRIL